ncbi:hypothetical protein [Catalinimonas niigatensis]|uniref:hypothetical protein n=1 Tax=Catalinimonas niigatensis TaxID=1397264 RepID=UPI0026654325|nr:hypothetical protein [Catalinimonas niigatensis]WPP51743.1 hypothetical protein PZB72_05000 [Catalinimonas niigatensis]
MRNTTLLTLPLVLVMLFATNSYAQLGSLGRKLKEKAADLMIEEIEGEESQEETSAGEENTNSSSSVKGKKLTPPSVNDHLEQASMALQSAEYSNARFNIKEATRGVELEIGYQILEAMPTEAAGMAYVPDNDGVVSTGIGFIGLVISREYGDGDKMITASIGNNSVFGATYGYLLNSSYNSNEGNYKNVSLQGKRGTMAFDDENTYTLGVAFAQSSAFVLECQGFSSEEEVMAAANDFDISTFEALLTDEGSDDGQSNDVNAYLSTAQSKYSSKDLEASRFELQRALTEVDIMIGKKILEMLPTELGDMKAIDTNDEYVASTAGFAGVYVQRIYESADQKKRAEVSLIDDSPMMAMVSAFLSSPLLMAVPGKQTIKIDGYRGMFEKTEDADYNTFNISLPSNQSLLTINFTDVNETDANKFANMVPVGEIFTLVK